MFAVALAAVSALVWGSGDYVGGRAARRANALAVTVLSQLSILPLLVVAAFLVPHGAVRLGDLAWGGLAGLAGFLGILLLYRGLAAGSMAIFSPVSAVTAAVIPMVIGLVTDRVPNAVALAGAACAVVAIGLVSIGPAGAAPGFGSRMIGLALATGTMFGLFFASLGQTSGDGGLWPMVAVRIGSVGLGSVLLYRTSTTIRMTGAPLTLTVLAGLLDITANALYLFAVTDGPMSIIAPVASLYPASTVMLALALDRERLRLIQVAGLGLAATALVLAASPT
jgi:drug/metabolite transporter (DMT)-like permease